MTVWVVTKTTAMPYNGEQTSVVAVFAEEEVAVKWIESVKKPGQEHFTVYEYEQYEVNEEA